MADFRYTYDLAMDKVSKKQSLKDLEQFSKAINKVSPEISPFSQKDLQRLDRDLGKAKAIITDTFEGQSYVQFDELNKSLTKAGINLQDVNDKVLRIKKAEDAVGGIATKYKRMAQEVGKVAVLHNRLNKFVSTFRKLVNFKVSIAAYQLITEQFRMALEFIKDLDKTLTEIATVSGASRKQLLLYAQDFNLMAEQMGRTTNEMAEASVIFFRQGKATAEVMELVEATTIAASIAHTEMAQTSEYLTATLNGFKLEATEAMAVVDKFSAIAANAGTSFEELAIGLTKVASGANAAGIDIDSMMSFIATVSEATRETATNVGTSFKTIIARFRGITADGHESAATLNSVDKALQSIGVSLRDETTGQLRDLADVIPELGAKWQDLDTNTKAYLATVAAGTRQQNRFIALMDNYDRSLEILEISLNSAGAAQAQFGEFSKGLEFSVNQLKASLERLWTNLVSSDDVKFLIQSLTKIIKGFTYLSENFSSLTFFAIAFNKQLTAMAVNIVATSTVFRTATQSLNGNATGLKKLTAGYKALSAERAKVKADKFAEQVLDPSKLERYKTGLYQANKAHREASVALKDVNERIKTYSDNIASAKIKTEAFRKTFSQLGTEKKLETNIFKERSSPGTKTQGIIDPKTFQIADEKAYNALSNYKKLSFEQVQNLRVGLEYSKKQVGIIELNKDKMQEMVPIQQKLEASEKALKDAVAAEKKFREQTTLQMNKQARSAQLLKLATISTLIAVTSIADAFANADGTIEDTRDRILKLANSLASIGLLMGGPIVKAISAAALVVGALVDRFWKTNREQLEKFRNEIDGLQEDLSTLNEIKDSYEDLRAKAQKGGIKFLDPEEKKQFFDYMQRIADIDKDLVIDFSADGRAIVDYTKSINELIIAQEELIETNKENITNVEDIEKAWKESSIAALDYQTAAAGGFGRGQGSTLPSAESGRSAYYTNAAEAVEEDLEALAAESRRIRTELLFDYLPLLQTETEEFKTVFIEQWLDLFEGEDINKEMTRASREFYASMNEALAEGAKEGTLTTDSAEIMVNDLLDGLTESFDLSDEQLAFMTEWADLLIERFIKLSEETLTASNSIDQILSAYVDFEKSVSSLKDAKQTLVDEQELESETVLALVQEYGSLLEYLDLTAENYGITAEALDEASDIMVRAELDKQRATLTTIETDLQAAEANFLRIDSLFALAKAQQATIPYSITSIGLQRQSILNNVNSLRAQQLALRDSVSKMLNFTLETEKAKDETDDYTASLERSNLEFKNMNELLEDATATITNLRSEIKRLEEDLQDADLGTISTLEAHIEAYDKLRGALEGQLNLQDNLREEALGGLTQILDVLENDVPGINLNDIIVDGKVDSKGFNNLTNFIKDEVNLLNKEIAEGRGTKEVESRIKIYHTLIDEVEKYKDAIEKSDIAIDKVNESLEESRKQQQEYYESILLNTLTYIEDALKQKFEKALEEIQETHEKSVEQIETEKELWTEIIDQQKERLDIEKDLRDAERERRDLLKDIGDKQAEINKLSLDDSLFAKKRIQELNESLEQDRADLEDKEYDTSFDIRKTALEDLDIFNQSEFDARLSDLEEELALQEARYETILNKKNLEISAELIAAGGEIKTLSGQTVDLESLLTELGETISKTGTREQREGFEEFKEELGFVDDLLTEIGLTYEGVVIDWSQIESENLPDFEKGIIDAALQVGDSFSGSILEEFKTGTSTLVEEIGAKAEEMTIKIGEHANSIVDIYRGMVVDINKELDEIGSDVETPTIKGYEGPDSATVNPNYGKYETNVMRVDADKVELDVKGTSQPDSSTVNPNAGLYPIIIDSSTTEKEFNDVFDRLPEFANGGLVEDDGPAMLHGEGDPEWIFNSSQLDSVIQLVNERMLGGLVNSMLSNGTNQEAQTIIENLINIEGNATEETVQELKKLAKKIAPHINKELVNNIKKR